MFPIIQWASLADVQKHPNQIVSYCIPLFTNIIYINIIYYIHISILYIYHIYTYIYIHNIVILSLKWSDPHDFAWNPASFPSRNQSFIIVEDAQLPSQRGWDGICGLGWKGIAQLKGPIYQHLQEMGQKAWRGGHPGDGFFWDFFWNLGRIKMGIWWGYN
jgi:hypothetical protein